MGLDHDLLAEEDETKEENEKEGKNEEDGGKKQGQRQPLSLNFCN